MSQICLRIKLVLFLYDFSIKCIVNTGMRSKKILWALFFVSLIFAGIFLLRTLPNLLRYERLPSSFEVDAIVVLDGDNDARVELASSLYEKYGRPYVIMTGSPLLNTSMPQLMKNYAISLDVDANKILLETNSFSTADHPLNILTILDKYKIRSILIVTSDYHTKRSYMTFKSYFEKEHLDIDLYVIGASSGLYDPNKKGYWKDHEKLQLVSYETQKLLYYFFFVF